MAVPQRARLRDWLEDVAEETAKATKRALGGRTPGRTVQMGASGSPTSLMDRIAERVIIHRFRDAPIPLNLISEETGIYHEGAEWWLIADPVDGSRNALHGIPFYCVSLAIGRRDLSGVELGLVRSIPTPDTWWGELGRGATLNGRKLKTRRLSEEGAFVGTALDYARGLRLPENRKVHLRDLGSAALEMCYVAQGAFDGFYCPQRLLRVIDVAAATLVVHEAGGHVEDLQQKPLNVAYDLQSRFGMLAMGDRRLWRMLR